MREIQESNEKHGRQERRVCVFRKNGQDGTSATTHANAPRLRESAGARWRCLRQTNAAASAPSTRPSRRAVVGRYDGGMASHTMGRGREQFRGRDSVFHNLLEKLEQK